MKFRGLQNTGMFVVGFSLLVISLACECGLCSAATQGSVVSARTATERQILFLDLLEQQLKDRSYFLFVFNDFLLGTIKKQNSWQVFISCCGSVSVQESLDGNSIY